VEPLTTNINLAKLYNVIDNKVAKAENTVEGENHIQTNR
jgi:hypothetical protein